MATLEEAIHYIYPNAEFSYLEDDYNTIKWINLPGTAPTIEEIRQTMIIIDKNKAIMNIENEYSNKMSIIKNKLFDAMMVDNQEDISAAKIEYSRLKTELETIKSKL